MRLVLVHGINQQGKSSVGLIAEWLEGLRAQAKSSAWPDPVSVAMPFYGEILFDLTEAAAKPQRTLIAQGVSSPPRETLEVSSSYADELRARFGIGEAEIAQVEAELAAEDGAVEIFVPQGSLVHSRRTKAILRIVERASPFHGDVALRLLGQAHAYLTRLDVARAVDTVVRPVLASDEETVVVAHSLGTIVTYKLLRELGARVNIKLYMTLGSPLGLASVKKALRPGLAFPTGVRAWVNAGDPDDFVAMQTHLNGIYDGRIEDLDGIRNGDADKHAIVDYLNNQSVWERILAAV